MPRLRDEHILPHVIESFHVSDEYKAQLRKDYGVEKPDKPLPKPPQTELNWFHLRQPLPSLVDLTAACHFLGCASAAVAWLTPRPRGRVLTGCAPRARSQGSGGVERVPLQRRERRHALVRDAGAIVSPLRCVLASLHTATALTPSLHAASSRLSSASTMESRSTFAAVRRVDRDPGNRQRGVRRLRFADFCWRSLLRYMYTILVSSEFCRSVRCDAYCTLRVAGPTGR